MTYSIKKRDEKTHKRFVELVSLKSEERTRSEIIMEAIKAYVAKHEEKR